MADMSKGKYKKPHRINPVSVSVVLILAGLGYLGYTFGPAYLDDSRIREVLREAASRYYKLSFLEETARSEASNELVADTRKKIIDIIGSDDEETTVQLLLDEETKKVNVVADYNRVVTWPGLDKTRVLHFHSVGESDYVNTGN